MALPLGVWGAGWWLRVRSSSSAHAGSLDGYYLLRDCCARPRPAAAGAGPGLRAAARRRTVVMRGGKHEPA